MSYNVDIHRRDFADSLQTINWILDLVANCQMTRQVSYFVLGSLVEMDK